MVTVAYGLGKVVTQWGETSFVVIMPRRVSESKDTTENNTSDPPRRCITLDSRIGFLAR